jgi:hypothetical protein
MWQTGRHTWHMSTCCCILETVAFKLGTVQVASMMLPQWAETHRPFRPLKVLMKVGSVPAGSFRLPSSLHEAGRQRNDCQQAPTPHSDADSMI